MTNNHTAVGRRHAAPASGLILAHKKHRLRWSKGCRGLLALGKQLDDYPKVAELQKSSLCISRL